MSNKFNFVLMKLKNSVISSFNFKKSHKNTRNRYLSVVNKQIKLKFDKIKNDIKLRKISKIKTHTIKMNLKKCKEVVQLFRNLN